MYVRRIFLQKRHDRVRTFDGRTKEKAVNLVAFWTCVSRTWCTTHIGNRKHFVPMSAEEKYLLLPLIISFISVVLCAIFYLKPFFQFVRHVCCVGTSRCSSLTSLSLKFRTRLPWFVGEASWKVLQRIQPHAFYHNIWVRESWCLMPDDIDENTGNSEVLHTKHPAAKAPD